MTTLKPEPRTDLDETTKQTNGLTEEQVKLLLAAAGRRKNDPAYIKRLLKGAAEYRHLLQNQESKTQIG